MKRLVRYDIDGYKNVLVEIDEDLVESGGVTPAGGLSRASDKAVETFGESMKSIPIVAQSILATVDSLDRSVTEVTVSFGIKMTGGVDVILVSGSAEANLNVTLTWKYDHVGG